MVTRRMFPAVVLAGALALSGCSILKNNTGNIAACSAALIASGSFDPGALAAVAATNPACQALEAAGLQALIDLVVTKNAARRGIIRP